MTRGNRPAIARIGRVEDVGEGNLFAWDWAFDQCVTGCTCHRNPATGHLALHEDQLGGHFGLRSFASGGCSCCQPWTALELAGIVQDLAGIDALDVPAEGPA